MEYHVEHRLRLHTEPEYKSLYRWAINEVDAAGKAVGPDQIPWEWRLSFSAVSCILYDGIEIKPKWQADESSSAPNEVTQQRVIHVQLRPGDPRDEGKFHRQTTFSMFGTKRQIKAVQLEIRQLSDGPEQEKCTAWGSVSYTSEIDFQTETFEDCIVFYLYVKPETFARYATMIARGAIDELIFSVRSVDGFYSEWSPSISTRNVKVLTRGEGHAIQLPPLLGFEPPRLGLVGEAELYLNRRLEFVSRIRDVDDHEPLDQREAMLGAQVSRAGAAPDLEASQIIASLQRVAQLIAVLLALIFLVLLMKR